MFKKPQHDKFLAKIIEKKQAEPLENSLRLNMSEWECVYRKFVRSVKLYRSM